jgi:hypothetical protein
MASNNIAPYTPMQPVTPTRVKELFGIAPLEAAAGSRSPAFFTDGTLLALDSDTYTCCWDPITKVWDPM